MVKKSKKQELEDAEDLYNSKAAAMIPYPVDIYGKSIDIPEDEVEKAKEKSLMIQHLINRGFEINPVAKGSIIKKEVFNPSTKAVVKKVAEVEPDFVKVGDEFKIANVGMNTICTEVKGDTVYFKHVGSFSNPIGYALDTVKEMVKRSAWVKIN